MRTFTDVLTGGTYEYSVGDKFVYVDWLDEETIESGLDFPVDDILELIQDDYDTCPLFRSSRGVEQFEYLKYLTPYIEPIPEDTPKQFTLKDLKQLDIVTMRSGVESVLVGESLLRVGGFIEVPSYNSKLTYGEIQSEGDEDSHQWDIMTVHRRTSEAWSLEELLEKKYAQEVYSRKADSTRDVAIEKISELKSKRVDIDKEIDTLIQSLKGGL